MEVCPMCQSAWRPINMGSIEKCSICQFRVAVDCCSGTCENEPMEKTDKTNDITNTTDG